MPPISQLLRPGWEAFRTYWPLFIVIQLAALGVLLSYYLLEGTAHFYAWVGTVKTEGGWLFAGVATVLSAGIVPELLKSLQRPAHVPRPSWGEILHQLVLWFIVGCNVYFFYKLQAFMFGEGTDCLTVIKKVLVDQLLFTPWYNLPIVAAWYLWREMGYRIGPVMSALGMRFYRERVLPIWATALMFWPVMLLIVYSLPADLQFPLFLCANAAWSILMIFILRRQGE
ncbi:MAG: hypothetical protein JJU20_09900 [Opitutales bacterium]|nr:hypothetical protein [Opitutales bacterium]